MMKTILHSGLPFVIMLLFTACRKEAPALSNTDISYENAFNLQVSGNAVAVKLVNTEAFTDPCFYFSFDNTLVSSFRFTGSHQTWSFGNMQRGQHLLSFTCMHPCSDEDHEKIMMFEINDGKNIQSVTVGETGHCKHDFWITVSN